MRLQKLAATALWVGAKLEEVREVSKHPRELLEKVMVTIDRCTVRREHPGAIKLPMLEPGSKVRVCVGVASSWAQGRATCVARVWEWTGLKVCWQCCAGPTSAGSVVLDQRLLAVLCCA
jgi:hypothetical protein